MQLSDAQNLTHELNELNDWDVSETHNETYDTIEMEDQDMFRDYDIDSDIDTHSPLTPSFCSTPRKMNDPKTRVCTPWRAINKASSTLYKLPH